MQAGSQALLDTGRVGRPCCLHCVLVRDEWLPAGRRAQLRARGPLQGLPRARARMRPLLGAVWAWAGACQCEGPSSASLFVAVVILVVSVMTSATLSVSVPAVAAHSARPSFAGSRCHIRPSKVDGVCCACRHRGLECGMHVLHGSRRDSQRSTLRPVCIQAPPRQGETSSAGAPSPRYRNERQSSQCAVEWASQATPRRINSAPSAQAPSHDADACTQPALPQRPPSRQRSCRSSSPGRPSAGSRCARGP